MMRTLLLNGRIIPYTLQRKQVKNINLRIYPDGRVCVSAHPRVPEAVIEQFMQSRVERICQALDRFEAARQKKPLPLTYTEGELLFVLGEPYRLCVRQSKKGSVEMEKGVITLFVPNPEDAEQRKKVLEQYLDLLCRQNVTRLCDEIYPSFASLGISYPTIRFRRMKSRWGSCHLQKKILTFNLSLVLEPIECVEYVVWHEFVHFLHPDHSKDFYATLGAYLPDWKARRDRLNKKKDA